MALPPSAVAVPVCLSHRSAARLDPVIAAALDAEGLDLDDWAISLGDAAVADLPSAAAAIWRRLMAAIDAPGFAAACAAVRSER